MLRTIANGLRSLFRKKNEEQEMDEELRAYLENSVKSKMRSGMSREEALRAARIEMGSVTAVKDEIRSAGWETSLESLGQDVRYGLRMLRKNAALTAIVVVTLALGIGANTSIFSLINAVMLRYLPVHNPQELVEIRRQTGGPESSPIFTNALWEALRDRQDVFSNVFAWGNEEFNLTQGGPVHFAHGIWVSGDFFPGLMLRPATGRLFAPSDDRRGCGAIAVLSYSFWQDHFGGDESAIGSSLSLNGHPVPIVGVAPAGFYGMNVGSRFDVALPICAAAIFDGAQTRLDHRSWWWSNIGGRVKAGISPEQLKSRLAMLSPQVMKAALPPTWPLPAQKRFIASTLVTSPGATGISNVRRQFERPLRVLMAVVGVVLFIACANIASLMLARSAHRRREIAVRQALGASRRRLVRQLLTECILLSSAGAILGMFLARWSTTLLVRYISTANSTVFLDLSLDGRVLGFTAAIAVLTGILFGVLPALRSTRVSLTAAMKGSEAPDTERRTRFRAAKYIVGAQVALSLVLLVAAGLFLRSFVKLMSLDAGFDRSKVLLVVANLKTTTIPPEQEDATFHEIETRIRALPGVVSAGRSWNTPISGYGWDNDVLVDTPNAPKGDDAEVYFNFISPAYFGTLRTPLLAGRNFTDHDTKTSASVAIVNETFARKFFPGRDALGGTFRIDALPGEKAPSILIVGIAKDAKYESLREQTYSTAFFPVTQMPGHAERETFEVRTAASPLALANVIQNVVAGVNKEIPLEFRTLSGQVDDSLVEDRLLALLSGFFGALALLLAMIGLYGTLSYLVTQRRIEFGVRMALGARISSITHLVLKDVAAVLAGGLLVGVVISLLSVGPLQKLLFDLGARDWVTMLLAVGVLSTVALIAAYLPARRAARVDPMKALRHE